MVRQVEALTHQRDRLDRALEPRYKIVGLIGSGAMSSVYLAWEFALQRRVAIKVLSPAFEQHLEDRERFRREARIAANLAHPHIVPVLGYEQQGGVTFFVMPYVPGESLARRLEREGGRLATPQACRILAELADALQAVHRAGVIHRDLKPDNILLDGDTGAAVLTDFGVATLLTSDHSRSEVPKAFGTPHYMSPEHALGEIDSDGRSDLYALGVLGYRMLTGRLPFVGASARAVVAQHVAAEATPVDQLAPDVPASVSNVIARCLAKDPAHRWPSAQALLGALRAALARLEREPGRSPFAGLAKWFRPAGAERGARGTEDRSAEGRTRPNAGPETPRHTAALASGQTAGAGA
jgi:serine/threonine-protein kinase